MGALHRLSSLCQVASGEGDVARWKSQGKYPGIFVDENDPSHWRIVVNLGRAAKGEPRRRAVKVIHGTLGDARAACTPQAIPRTTRRRSSALSSPAA